MFCYRQPYVLTDSNRACAEWQSISFSSSAGRAKCGWQSTTFHTHARRSRERNAKWCRKCWRGRGRCATSSSTATVASSTSGMRRCTSLPACRATTTNSSRWRRSTTSWKCWTDTLAASASWFVARFCVRAIVVGGGVGFYMQVFCMCATLGRVWTFDSQVRSLLS